MTAVRRLEKIVKSELGQTIIEFAFTIPIVLLLFFGLMDFGRAAYTAAVVQWAAQEGARAGTIDPTSVEDAAKSRMVGLNVDQAVVPPATVSNGIVTVQVTYPFEFATPMIQQIAGQNIQMQGTASMVIQPAMMETP